MTELGQTNEWNIYGPSHPNAHTLHVHVNHMQIVNFECIDNDCEAHGVEDWAEWFQIGDWRDTLPAFPGRLTVRFRPTDFDGEAVLHCHHLRHEDLGMMDTVLLRDCDNPDEGRTCEDPCFRNSALCDVVPTTVPAVNHAGQWVTGAAKVHSLDLSAIAAAIALFLRMYSL